MTTTFVNRPQQKALEEIQSIPCRLDHTGTAQVSKYFHREELANGYMKATFRGRPLDGHVVTVPDGYKLHLLKERQAGLGDPQKKTFEVHGAIDKLTVWNLDKEPSEKDPIKRAINWTRIAQALDED